MYMYMQMFGEQMQVHLPFFLHYYKLPYYKFRFLTTNLYTLCRCVWKIAFDCQLNRLSCVIFTKTITVIASTISTCTHWENLFLMQNFPLQKCVHCCWCFSTHTLSLLLPNSALSNGAFPSTSRTLLPHLCYPVSSDRLSYPAFFLAWHSHGWWWHHHGVRDRCRCACCVTCVAAIHWVTGRCTYM